MNWPKIVLLAFYALSMITTTAQVGKPRKPLEPGVASASLVVIGLLAWMVVIA